MWNWSQSDKTQAGNCEPNVSEKDDMKYTISTKDTQIYYKPKHLKYKWIPWPYFEGYNINLTLTDMVVSEIVKSKTCTRWGWWDSWRDYAV